MIDHIVAQHRRVGGSDSTVGDEIGNAAAESENILLLNGVRYYSLKSDNFIHPGGPRMDEFCLHYALVLPHASIFSFDGTNYFKMI